MKIPLVWLKDYVDTSKSAKDLSASFTQLGLMLDKPLDEKNVLDLEHRMDRADWLSIIGCVRDLAAFEDLKLKLPKGYGKAGKTLDPQDQIKVSVDTPSVRRFQTRIIKGIKVGPSPKWLTERLELYGMDSINNIVDITNFVMIEYGQPMHAQDIAKLKGMDITIRPAKPGEKLTTLLGTEVKLDKDAFVLTSGGEVTVIGGIVGGKNTGVTSDTVDIVLDSGNYDSKVIRRISRKLKIINESVSRNDKFLDPRLIDPALDRATALILELAGGTYYANDDYYPSVSKPKTQILRLSRLKLLSGMDLSLETAKKILKSLDYAVIEEGSDSLTVEIPYFRTDVEVEDDLVADVLRIYNYSNIENHPLDTPVPKDITSKILSFEERLKDLLVAQGAHEHITNSLTSVRGDNSQVKLANALTSDLNALRTELVSGLSKVAKVYRKHKLSDVTIFEIGKVFSHAGKNYLEERLLSVLSSNSEASATSLATLMSSLGISTYQINSAHQILVSQAVVGTKAALSYTLITNELLSHAKNYSGIVSEFDHTTSLDLSLLAGTHVLYSDIDTTISSLKGAWQTLRCKSMTKMENGHNYLITLTWDADSKTIESDKNNVLKTLKDKLDITSKS